MVFFALWIMLAMTKPSAPFVASLTITRSNVDKHWGGQQCFGSVCTFKPHLSSFSALFPRRNIQDASRTSLFYSLWQEDADGDSKPDSNDEITERRLQLQRSDSLKIAASDLKRMNRLNSNAKIVDDIFSTVEDEKRLREFNFRPLVDLNLAGQGFVGQLNNPQRSLANQSSKTKPIRCLFLSIPSESDDFILQFLDRRYPDHGDDIPDTPIQLSNSKANLKSDRKLESTVIPAVPLPIPLTREQSKELKLLAFAFRGRYISKSVFLPLATILTNRDGCLWDNLPWTEWTIDPELRNRDTFGKVIPKKYLLGKRDAYNRMIGRDWYGRSLSAGNTAARLKYNLEDFYEDNDVVKSESSEKLEMDSSLALRIIQLQLEEAKMDLAEAEQSYSVLKNRLGGFDEEDILVEYFDEIQKSVQTVDDAIERKDLAEEALRSFLGKSDSDENRVLTDLDATVNDFLADVVNIRFFNKDSNSQVDGEKNIPNWKDVDTAVRKFVNGIRQKNDLMEDLGTILDRERQNASEGIKKRVFDFLDGVIEKETKNAPPYRGAMGYSPRVDTREEMFNKSVLPYRSPYDLLVEIIEEQFNAEVVGAVLENSSLFPGTLILEGAIVIRRRGRKKKINIGGEEVEIEDDEEDFGNLGVFMGDTLVVECAGEEAIGMALACDVPISVERKVWQEVRTDIGLGLVEPLAIGDLESVSNMIPPVKLSESDKTIVIEGGEALVQGGEAHNSKSMADEVLAEKEITIDSLEEYESLSIQDKARYVLSSGKFDGKLPRPRVLREFEQKFEIFQLNQRLTRLGQKDQQKQATTIRTTLSPLDEIIVPIIQNELVQLKIRLKDANLRDDQVTADAIREKIDNMYKIDKSN